MPRTPGQYFELEYKDKMSWDQCKKYVEGGMHYKDLAATLGISDRRAFGWWHKAKKELVADGRM